VLELLEKYTTPSNAWWSGEPDRKNLLEIKRREIQHNVNNNSNTSFCLPSFSLHPSKYLAVQALFVIDEDKNICSRARQSIRRTCFLWNHFLSGIQVENKENEFAVDLLPESSLPYLIHLLAHHPRYQKCLFNVFESVLTQSVSSSSSSTVRNEGSNSLDESSFIGCIGELRLPLGCYIEAVVDTGQQVSSNSICSSSTSESIHKLFLLSSMIKDNLEGNLINSLKATLFNIQVVNSICLTILQKKYGAVMFDSTLSRTESSSSSFTPQLPTGLFMPVIKNKQNDTNLRNKKSNLHYQHLSLFSYVENVLTKITPMLVQNKRYSKETPKINRSIGERKGKGRKKNQNEEEDDGNNIKMQIISEHGKGTKNPNSKKKIKKKESFNNSDTDSDLSFNEGS
jgi:hypothetical protein